MLRVSRREFVRTSVLMTAATIASACAVPPTSLGADEVPTSAPAGDTAPQAPTAPSEAPSRYYQAPMLDDSGLPPLEERLPESPVVIPPLEEIGQYGGTWHMVVETVADSHVGEFVQYEPILRYTGASQGFSVVPNIAESWEVSPDGQTYTFQLVKGIKWSDGEPFTAEDIVFWSEIRQDKEIYPAPPTWYLAAGMPPEITALDDFTVQFAYANPAPFLARWLGRHSEGKCFSPKHFLSKFHPSYSDPDSVDALVRERGYESWAQLYLDQDNPARNPDLPSIFAWKLMEFEPIGAVHDRNPYYWKVDPEGKQLPYIDRVETEVVANIEVGQMKAFSGEADMQVASTGQAPNHGMILKKNAEMGNYTVVDAPWSEPNVLQFALNLTCKDAKLRELFRDKRFRIALSHAVKREDVAQLVYLGQHVELRQVAPLRQSEWYHEGAAQTHVEYLPDTSNQLLDEIGLTQRDADGFRTFPDGSKLEFVLEVVGKRVDFIDAMNIATENWRDVGINATSKPTETSLYFERLRANELQAGTDYTGGGLFPALEPQRHIPVSNAAVWASDWGLWYSSKGASGEEPPAEVKKQLELYDELLATLDESKQKDLWNQIEDINAENRYHFGICDRPPLPVVVSNKFHNVLGADWDYAWEAGNVGTSHPEQYWKDA